MTSTRQCAIQYAFDGVAIIIDKDIPLKQRDPKTGEMVPLAFFEFGGKIYMHPERFIALKNSPRVTWRK